MVLRPGSHRNTLQAIRVERSERARAARRRGGRRGPVRALGCRAPGRATRARLRRADADLANADAAGHAAAVGLGGDLAVGSGRPRLDRRLGRGRRRARAGADPAADVPALRRLVPRHVRARDRPADVAQIDRAAGASGITTTAGEEARRSRASWSRSASPPSPTRHRRSTRRWATASLRDRSARTTPYRRPTRDRRRRRPGRSRGRGARPPRRGRGRGDRPLAAALVHGPRAVHAARRRSAAAVPRSPIPSWATGRLRSTGSRCTRTLFAALPEAVRRRVARRILRAGGSPWVALEIEGRVAVTEGVAVRGSPRTGGGLHARARATAPCARPTRWSCLDGLPLLARAAGLPLAGVRAGVTVHDGWPVLDRWFRSTDPDAAVRRLRRRARFGPIARFVSGSRFTAHRVGGARRDTPSAAPLTAARRPPGARPSK